MLTYYILSMLPFVVLYQHPCGLSETVEYPYPLLKKEIEAEMPYITFNELSVMRVKKYGDEVMLMEGHKIITHLPQVK